MKDSEPVVIRTTFEEMLKKNKHIVYTNVGHSMMPLLRQRKDVIEIKKKEPGRCKKYDVVLYKYRDKYILHRVLEVLPDGKYIIAGDNTFVLEKDITDEQIIGVMTRVIRDGRSIYMDNKTYRVYVHLWCDAYPIRMGILKVKSKTKAGLLNIKKMLS